MRRPRMNKLNYASLKASRRLVDAGIVLETDLFWVVYAGKTVPQPYLADRKSFNQSSWCVIPAPSMAEVWRMLPECVKYKKDDRPLIEYLRIDKNSNGSLSCGYSQYSEMTSNINPTDALIDLLIWVRKEVNHADK
jgi:hypothetical protein